MHFDCFKTNGILLKCSTREILRCMFTGRGVDVESVPLLFSCLAILKVSFSCSAPLPLIVYFFSSRELVTAIHSVWTLNTPLNTFYNRSSVSVCPLCCLSLHSSSHFFTNITSLCDVTEQPLPPAPSHLLFSAVIYSLGPFSMFVQIFLFQQRWKKSLVKENERDSKWQNRVSRARSNCSSAVMLPLSAPFNLVQLSHRVCTLCLVSLFIPWRKTHSPLMNY